MNNKLQLIREKCIAANPEIMESKFGCEVEWTYSHALNSSARTPVTKRGVIFSRDRNPTIFLYGNVSLRKDVPIEELKIIGRPIRLTDVLLAMKDDPTFCGFDYDNFFLDFPVGKFDSKRISWNLRADDLEKQSEECINFLAELLQ